MCVCVKYFHNRRKPEPLTDEMIKTAFCEKAISHTHIYKCFCYFQDGRTFTESDECSGRPSLNTYEMTATIRDLERAV